MTAAMPLETDSSAMNSSDGMKSHPDVAIRVRPKTQ
jgi:hypothetical protein